MRPLFRFRLHLLLALVSTLGSLGRATPPPAPPGFSWVRNEAFSDEFDGDRLDLAKWHDHHPYWEGRAPAKFMARSVAVKDGMLQIRNSPLPPAEATGKFTIAGGAVVSRSAAGHYGYYEARMKASGISMSSTFWLTNQPVAVTGGTAKQEIDINEALGVSQSFPKWPAAMHANTHYFFQPTDGKKIDKSRPGTHPITPASDEAFHTYGAWWVDANTVHFYCDGAFAFTLHPDTTYSPTPLDRPMYLNLVTETYNWEPAPTPASLADNSKNTTTYDWVRAYTLVADAKPAAPAAVAALPTSLSPDEAPWRTIFNGQDYTGWKVVGPAKLGYSEVKDGEFQMQMRGETTEHTYVRTDEEFGDFIMELDVKHDSAINAGLLLRCIDAPDGATLKLNGYQVKLDHNVGRKWTGGLFDDFGPTWRWLYDLRDDARARTAFKTKTWIRFRIEALGNTLKVWVNGIPTAHLIDDKYRRGAFAFKIHWMTDAAKGPTPIAHYKNIRVITENPGRYAQAMDLAPRRAPPAPEPDDGGITLPEGFRATVVADNLVAGRKGDTLRFLAVAPNFDVYANTRKGGIIALRDTNFDGRADVIQEFGSGGGTGLALQNNFLYASSASAVYRYKLAPNELVPAAARELIAQLPVQQAHDAKAFAFDPAGDLYVDIGAPLNVFSPPPPGGDASGGSLAELQRRHGGIWRFKGGTPNQDQARDGYRFTSGLRHALSLAWNPVKQAFYVVMMGRDQLNTVAPQFYTAKDNAESPAEEMHLLRDQGDLGWPTAYYDPIRRARMLAPEWGGDGKKTAEPGKYPDPLVAFPAHWAPMQMAFNYSEQFPARYFGGAFIAFHGSWNRGPEPQRGYCVAFVPFGRDGLPTGKYEVFADNFAGREVINSPGDARFRPCGLAFGPDGTLYVGDSEKGRIWRIVYTGEPRPSRARTVMASPASAPAEVLRSPEAARHAAYQTYCGVCHMADGRGVSGLQPSLVDSAAVAGDPARLIRMVLNSPAAKLPADRPKYSNVMPGLAMLSDADLAGALTHIRENFVNAAAITPAQVATERSTIKP